MALEAGSDEAIRTLVTVRDWLRYAVGRFNRAKLTFGHGTINSVDEAAFMILEALRLPIDDINPWLDARLLDMERYRLAELIEARVKRRLPAAYLLNAAYIQGRRFYVDERVIVPRSYIGELIAADGLAAVVDDARQVRSVLDLCTGSGCLALLAAEAWPDATIDATDISVDALLVAQKNIANWGMGSHIKLLQGDGFAPVADRRYDLIIANPPYVAAAEVAAFSAEYRAEPELAHAGGRDGLDLVRRILAGAAGHLTPSGKLVVEIGTGRHILEAERPDLAFLWLDSANSTGEVFALEAAALAPAAKKPDRKPRAKTKSTR